MAACVLSALCLIYFGVVCVDVRALLLTSSHPKARKYVRIRVGQMLRFGQSKSIHTENLLEDTDGVHRPPSKGGRDKPVSGLSMW